MKDPYAVNVDSAESVPASLVTCGARYAQPRTYVYDPDIPCPRCAVPVTRVTPKALLEIVTARAGKTVRTGMPACPVDGVAELLGMFAYYASPCGCRVDLKWAGSFVAEKQVRLPGRSPQKVQGETFASLVWRSQEFTKALLKLAESALPAARVWESLVALELIEIGKMLGDEDKPVTAVSSFEDYPPGYPMPKKLKPAGVPEVAIPVVSPPPEAKQTKRRRTLRPFK